MCLAIPGKIIAKIDMLGTVDVSGVTRQVSLMLLPEANIGDYVLVHAGFAIQTLDEEEAHKTLELFKELGLNAELDG